MWKNCLKNCVILLGFFLIGGCVPKTPVNVPIVNGWEQGAAISKGYTVQMQDTIYKIAWAFNKDYRELAELNHLKEPYLLKVGMKLRLESSPKTTFVMANSYHKKDQHKFLSEENSVKNSVWKLPVKSAVKYRKLASPAQAIDFIGKVGDAVFATKAGTVVYSGSSLAAYGNLIILKHSDDYFSAYAYNERNLVYEGEMVRGGQMIARLGRNRRGEAVLHFEIRYRGRSVAPHKYLDLH